MLSLGEPRPMWQWLTGLVLVALVPLATISLFVFVKFARDRQELVKQQMVDTTRALAIATERQVLGTVRRLEGLARDTLARENTAGFAELAREAASRGEFRELDLYDHTGQLLMRYGAGPAMVLPANATDVLSHVVETREPYISNVVSSSAGASSVFLAVPVIRNGLVTLVLVGVPPLPQQLLALMTEQRLPTKEGGGAIMDRNGIYIARTLNPETAVGHPASAQYRRAALASHEGIVKNVNPEGQAVYGTFVHTTFGWIAAIGAPASVIEAPYLAALYTFGAIWLGGLLLCLGLAVAGGRRIAATAQRLARAATEVGKGQIPVSRPERIAELDFTRRTLIQAAEQRDELMKEHAQAREAAVAANRAKDEFLAMLGHELRNPLAAITTAAAVLDAPDGRPAATTAARDVIRRQAQHLGRMVDDLLDVARLMTGKIDLRTSPVNLGDLVRTVVDSMRPLGHLGSHDVVVRAAPAWILGDDLRVEQIVSNLVGNALKYTPAGGRIDVVVTTDGDDAVLRVSDTGIGMPEHLVGRVFDLFVQGDRTADRSLGGLGIGLTLVRELVTRLGGTVEAHSDGLGRGSVLTVRFPRVEGGTEEAKRAAPQVVAATPRRILLIEDHDDSREMLRLQLSYAGHEVYEARDGGSGILLADKCDIALIDIGLPGLNGYEVARRIRARESGPPIVLVALTGYGQSEDRRRGFEAGFDLYLTKPVSPHDLDQTIATVRPRS
jgi:signal transduction histidine kinase